MVQSVVFSYSGKREAAKGFRGCILHYCFLGMLESIERNKIKILLRSQWDCAII